MKNVHHTINTGDARPLRDALCRHLINHQEVLDEQVKNMLKNNVIRPSRSSWSSNVVLVQKKDNKLRFCVDYRRLHEKTIKGAYPLPRISACLDALGDAQYFSIFDLRSGYHQVLMEPADAEKTAFVTRGGLYEYRLMPFGLCNAPTTFQRLMDLTLSDLNLLILLVYLDDIIVYSKTITEHLERLELLFRRLSAANLKLKPSKCFLLQKKVVFLIKVWALKTIKSKVLETGRSRGVLRTLEAS